MIRVFGMITTFIFVFVGVLALGAGGIEVWLAFGRLGLAALGVLGFAVALAWAAAERVGDKARRQEALKPQRQVAREVSRKEPRLAVPQQRRSEPRVFGNEDTTIIEWTVPAHQPVNREPRLFRDADDFTITEWTEDRRR
jgi:hypothetical protein